MLIGLSNHNAIDFNLYEPSAPVGEDKIRLADLDYYQRKHFPPCMKTLYTALKNQHHLKHYGRLQLGLFMKGLGLTLEESLAFWKKEFTKKHDIDGEKFEKNYAYNIRHSYGMEGKRQDYKPWTCNKVIGLEIPGAGEYHGCPFKTFNGENLKQVLSTYGLTHSEMATILEKKDGGHHQVACLRLFEYSTKNGVSENVGNHPNAFFTCATQHEKALKKQEKSK
jgi:DNA primase large subunit